MFSVVDPPPFGVPVIAPFAVLNVKPCGRLPLSDQLGMPRTFDAANAYGYVAMSVYYDAAGVPLWRCSGTMISPRVYVTAGHCTGLDEGSAHRRIGLTRQRRL